MQDTVFFGLEFDETLCILHNWGKNDQKNTVKIDKKLLRILLAHSFSFSSDSILHIFLISSIFDFLIYYIDYRCEAPQSARPKAMAYLAYWENRLRLGHSLVRLLTPLTHLLVPHCSLIRSLLRLIHSQACGNEVCFKNEPVDFIQLQPTVRRVRPLS